MSEKLYVTIAWKEESCNICIMYIVHIYNVRMLAMYEAFKYW